MLHQQQSCNCYTQLQSIKLSLQPPVANMDVGTATNQNAIYVTFTYKVETTVVVVTVVKKLNKNHNNNNNKEEEEEENKNEEWTVCSD